MEYFNNEIFGFSNDNNENLEQTNNFNYDSISGLGESNYENEDLFNTEVEATEPVNSSQNLYENYNFENVNAVSSVAQNNLESNTPFVQESNTEDTFVPFDQPTEPQVFEQPYVQSNKVFNFEPQIETYVTPVEPIQPIANIQESSNQFENSYDTFVNPINTEVQNIFTQPELNTLNDYNSQDNMHYTPDQFEVDEAPEINDQSNISVSENLGMPEEHPVEEEKSEPIIVSETPIEELNKLTQFKEERIEETDINSLFDKVTVNVKDASDIFRKNTDIKQKIDTRFEELKKLQSELENSRKKQIDEINRYKEEVLGKLTEKKEEIERRLNILKESQSTLEKEKQEFEAYKKKEQENIDRVQKEVQSAYDDRREELNHIEDVLRKQKDALDEERSQLGLDKIQYESDKNELANNLLKFNEIVNSFTNGVNDIRG